MASHLSWHIQCPVCLSDFVDPVRLPCDHSYCRDCITGHLQSSLGPSLCPECRSPYAWVDLKDNRLLKNITEAFRRRPGSPTDQVSPLRPAQRPEDMMCREHQEKLKLFCEADQKLTCTICKEQDKHQGHHFRPVKEAADRNKRVVKEALGFLVKENQILDDLTERQRGEMIKSGSLLEQITSQFEVMHTFLRNKEEELKKELQKQQAEAMTAMLKNLSVIETRAGAGREASIMLKSTLEIKEPGGFLLWWEDEGYAVTEGMKLTDGTRTKYKSKVEDVFVTPESVSLGPYETHLPFFVWKEMLTFIRPVPDRFTVKEPGDSYLKVSPDGFSIRQADRQGSLFKSYSPGAVTNETFQTGHHYFEVDVGGKLDWSIGIRVVKSKENDLLVPLENDIQLHLKHDEGLVFTHNDTASPVEVKDQEKPRKIGLYLDCERQQVSFYNAENMSLIHTSFCSFVKPCCISLGPGLYLDGKNSEALRVCCY
uniref:Uncharacterized protein n=1 Tax=Denticeps clupeoides TaxID=299321 RepID=A0AAY4AEY0_9TELE